MPVADANGYAPDPVTDPVGWRRMRLDGLGGSDVAAICGEHSERSAIDVYEERVSGDGLEVVASDELDDNEPMLMGRELEPVVLGLYARGDRWWPRGGGRYLAYKPPTMMHRDRPWQRGSADGLMYTAEMIGAPDSTESVIHSPMVVWNIEPDHGLEIKTHRWFAARAQYNRMESGVPVEVPADKRIQCVWYMELYKIKRWRLAALVDTSHRRTYEIEHDQEVADYLLEEAHNFWTRHVLRREPPRPDGSSSFSRYLSERFSATKPELVTATPEVEEHVRELCVARAELGALERRIEIAEQHIKEFIGDRSGLESALGRITYKHNQRGATAYKEVALALRSRLGLTDAEYAEYMDLHTKTPGPRVFLVPRKWKENK
jgi:predicted phage-related endonuclease